MWSLRYSQIIFLLPRLGWKNVIRAMGYRLLLKTGLHPVCKLKAKLSAGCFFNTESNLKSSLIPRVSTDAWVYSWNYFDWFSVKAPFEAPNWFGRPISGLPDWPSKHPWWRVAKPNTEDGDIKEIWELSRFHWAIAMAQRAANGDTDELVRLNSWLSDWVHKNPAFFGPNWRCGQEASIRVMHLAAAAMVLHQTSPSTPNIFTFLRAHLARISATFSYAISQDNNHGVLEAVGLFVGAEWIISEENDAQARSWAIEGRRWMEERALRLIAEDGSFSMYSVAYHREFLDALSFAEIWRRRLNLPSFSSRFMDRTAKAAIWLKAFTHQGTGDAPNIGANDGTRLFQFADTPYRDFRPSVQLACVLFCGSNAYDPGPWDVALHWLQILLPGASLPVEKSQQFDDGGFVILRGSGEDAQAFVRYPRFKFRPSQSDLLHVDLWVGGENLLRDAGSYGYHTEVCWLKYFGGTASHNTVQFDDRDQMPRLSRFLFGDWLKADSLQPLSSSAQATQFAVGYKDGRGARHHREVSLYKGRLQVVDQVQGFITKAVLRWRLQPGDWRLEPSPEGWQLVLNSEGVVKLIVSATVPVLRCELVQGWESRHYLEKTPVPVLEVEVQQSCTLTTEVHWAT
jgi:hypothetical protein